MQQKPRKTIGVRALPAWTAATVPAPHVPAPVYRDRDQIVLRGACTAPPGCTMRALDIYEAPHRNRLCVTQGENVRALRFSSNGWCLCRRVQRPDQFGWVPSAFLHVVADEDGGATGRQGDRAGPMHDGILMGWDACKQHPANGEFMLLLLPPVPSLYVTMP